MPKKDTPYKKMTKEERKLHLEFMEILEKEMGDDPSDSEELNFLALLGVVGDEWLTDPEYILRG